MQGFPGNVEAMVTYTLTPEGVLKARFEATTDQATPINMAQHTYWNLGGHSSGSILKHKLMINGYALFSAKACTQMIGHI